MLAWEPYRLPAAIREDLDAIAGGLTAPPEATKQLTVGQVARQLGVLRSTVYTHWREWGGYKLGPGTRRRSALTAMRFRSPDRDGHRER